MKISVKLLLIVVLSVMFTGCVGKVAQREAASGVKVVKESSAAIWVSSADAYIANGQLIVAGKVQASHDVRQHGHVDVHVIASDGSVVKKAVKVSGLVSKRSGVARLAFKAVFDQVPEDGSTVKVRYHRGSSDCSGEVKYHG